MMKADKAYKMTNNKIEIALKGRWGVAEKYSDEVVEPEILKAIENGQYETTIKVDEKINLVELMVIIITAGYKVKEVEERVLSISWE